MIAAARLRPALPTRTLPQLSTTLTTRRYASNIPTEEPSKKAQSIIDALPGSSLISKTAILSVGASLSAYAISNELYIVNEESIVMLATLSMFWAVYHYGGPMYKEWADGQVNKIKNILNAAREDHTNAVKARINNVKELGSVIDVTKQLFEVSKVSPTLGRICGSGSWLNRARRRPSLKLRLSNWSRRPLWPLKRSQYWIRG